MFKLWVFTNIYEPCFEYFHHTKAGVDIQETTLRPFPKQNKRTFHILHDSATFRTQSTLFLNILQREITELTQLERACVCVTDPRKVERSLFSFIDHEGRATTGPTR